MPAVFDQGAVEFGDLNMPRDEYVSAPPNDMSDFPNNPIATAFPFISVFEALALEGPHCQKTGLTPLGEFLIVEMMKRGMILEVDHLPQRSYLRAFELLMQNDYPATGTHGSNNNGLLYLLGGVSKTGFGRCRDAANPGSTLQGFKNRIAQIEAEGGYPAEGFGFDLNGLAGARGPRFGPNGCGTLQEMTVTHPFTSVAGDVTFTVPPSGTVCSTSTTRGSSTSACCRSCSRTRAETLRRMTSLSRCSDPRRAISACGRNPRHAPPPSADDEAQPGANVAAPRWRRRARREAPSAMRA